MSYRDPQGESERFQSRPKRIRRRSSSTRTTSGRTPTARFGGELVAQHGPLWFQGEYLDALTNGPQHNLYGYYVQAGWFLTGENRPYRRENGTIDRVRPRHSFPPGRRARRLGAGGALLEHRSRQRRRRGGQAHDFTFGINWYLNPMTRVTGNYVFSDRIGVGR
jgi:phosphate-selective porin OprO/OprP